MRKFGLAIAVAGALALGACSSDGDSGSSTPPASSAPASTSSSAAPSSSSAPSSTAAGGLADALLSSSDIGTGYTGGPTQNQQDDPLPCTPDQPGLNTQVKPSDKGDAQFKNSGDTVEIAETVTEYGDKGTSQKAFAAATKGFDCSSGTISGTKIKIVARQLTSGDSAGLDGLKAWDFTDGSTVKGTAVAIQLGKRFIGLTFVAKPNAGSDVDVQAISMKAVQKAG